MYYFNIAFLILYRCGLFAAFVLTALILVNSGVVGGVLVVMFSLFKMCGVCCKDW